MLALVQTNQPRPENATIVRAATAGHLDARDDGIGAIAAVVESPIDTASSAMPRSRADCTRSSGPPVNVDVVAESALEIVLVHYRDARASGNPCAYRYRAVAKATQFVFVCPQTGDYLLQFHNASVSSTNAIVSISSPLVVPTPSIPEPLDSTPVPGSTSALSLPRWFQPRLEE